MKNTIKVLVLVILTVSFLGLGACGKISKPEPIAGSGYPHSYPHR